MILVFHLQVLGESNIKINPNGHLIDLLIIHSSHSPRDSAAHQHQSTNLNSMINPLKGFIHYFLWCHAPAIVHRNGIIFSPFCLI